MNPRAVTVTKYKGGQGQTFASCLLAVEISRSVRTLLLTDSDDARAVLAVSPTDGDDPARIECDSRLTLVTVPTDWGCDALALAEYVANDDGGAFDYIITDLRDTPTPDALARVGFDVVRVVVVEPSYLALRATVREIGHNIDGHVITYDNPDGALKPRDVSTVLRPVSLAVVPRSPDVARVIDAGLLAQAFDRPAIRQYRDAVGHLLTDPEAITAPARVEYVGKGEK